VNRDYLVRYVQFTDTLQLADEYIILIQKLGNISVIKLRCRYSKNKKFSHAILKNINGSYKHNDIFCYIHCFNNTLNNIEMYYNLQHDYA